MRQATGFIITILSCLIVCSTSHAQSKRKSQSYQDSLVELNKVWDRVSVDIGGFFAGYNSGVALGSKQLGLGLQIDIESALGLDVTRWATRANIQYRFSKKRKHSVVLGYFGVNRRTSKILEAELNIGKLTIPLGTEINSRYDLDIIRVKYDYSFYQDDRVSIGASFGAFVMPVSFRVETQLFESETASFIAPLPLFGLRSDFKITDKFYLNQSAEILYLSIDNFTGSILDLTLNLGYRPIKFLGLGVGVNANRFELSAMGKDYPFFEFFGELKFGYTGVYLFASFHL